MKKLIVINGTMGVGKSATCRELLGILKPGVYLDGDWCWNMNPFVVNEENKAMVVGNIVSLLRSFLKNSGYEYIVFCWVIHQEEIFGRILDPLRDCEFKLYKISLVCSGEALEKRLRADILSGKRSEDVLPRSLARLPLYEKMNTVKIDVGNCSAHAAALRISKLVGAAG